MGAKNETSETGLMLYRNRFYLPELGRFLQRDPIGYDAGNQNVYRYVGNRVVTDTDALGLHGLPPIFGGPGDYVDQLAKQCRKVQNPKIPFATNGCTGVPDSGSFFNFKSSCDGHDICYETCGNSKDYCDKKMLADMEDSCQKMHKKGGRINVIGLGKCMARAKTYYRGLTNLPQAQQAYDDAQNQYCISADLV